MTISFIFATLTYNRYTKPLEIFCIIGYVIISIFNAYFNLSVYINPTENNNLIFQNTNNNIKHNDDQLKNYMHYLSLLNIPLTLIMSGSIFLFDIKNNVTYCNDCITSIYYIILIGLIASIITYYEQIVLIKMPNEWDPIDYTIYTVIRRLFLIPVAYYFNPERPPIFLIICLVLQTSVSICDIIYKKFKINPN